MTGLTLPGMIDEPGLARRQSDLGEARARPGGHQQQVLGDLGQVDGETAQGGRDGEHRRHRLRRVDEMLGGAQLEAGLLGEVLDHELDVLGLRVQACADGSGADVLLEQQVGGLRDALSRSADRQRVRRELLAEPDRHCILHVRAARLQDVVERASTLVERRRELVDDRQEVAHLGQRRDAHRRREDVVRGLRHVHVVVRVHDV